jgi:hypothetical protein
VETLLAGHVVDFNDLKIVKLLLIDGRASNLIRFSEALEVKSSVEEIAFARCS